MLITISNIIRKEELESIRATLNKLSWRDGASTAGVDAKSVKKNQQADLSSEIGKILHKQILEILQVHPVLLSAARPKRFSRLIVSQTTGEGHYGPHVDNALMETGGRLLRTDLSFTLFLSNPDEYEGGELSIQYPGFTQRHKPSAGDLVLYPSTQIHEVAPVTQGSRLACVGWIESTIRDQMSREVLFDLTNLKVSMSNKYTPQSVEMLTLNKNISNLLRYWSET